MSVEVATIERVRAASSALRAEGSRVTADAVIAHIGGGSKQTVLKHLKALRADPETQPSVPASVLDLVLPALAEVFHAGEQAEAERSRSQNERIMRMMDDLECQIEELAGDNSRLSAELEASRRQLADRETKHSAASDELGRANAEIRRLEKELQKDRDDSSKRLAKLMTQFEASLGAFGGDRAE